MPWLFLLVAVLAIEFSHVTAIIACIFLFLVYSWSPAIAALLAVVLLVSVARYHAAEYHDRKRSRTSG
jgi:CHASE2 domain-containing sensor protein